MSNKRDRKQQRKRRLKIVSFMMKNIGTLSRSEMAHAMRVSPATITKLCQQYHLDPVRKGYSTNEDTKQKIATISRLIRDGMTRRQIAAYTNIPYNTVVSICYSHNLCPPTDSELTIKFIRKNTHLTIPQIAQELGRTLGHIRRVCRDNNIWVAGMYKTSRWRKHLNNF